MPDLKMMLIEHCESGDLMRVFTGSEVAWAIKAGVAQSDAHWFVMLSGESAPWAADISDSSYLTSACLSYGKKFFVEPEHFDDIAVEQGNMLIEKGVLLFAKPVQSKDDTSRYIACTLGSKPDAVRRLYLNLDTFQLGAEPGGHRAAFRKWGVYAQMPTSREPVRLVGSPYRSA